MSFASQAAGMIGKLTGAVGGAPILTGLVIGGLVVGGLTGAFVSQVTTQGTTATALDIYPCWKSGTPFAKAPPGQQVWVTGKNADGTWLRVYTASPTHPEGWVLASLISLTQEGEAPVVDCAPIVAALLVGSPGETLTTLQNNSPSPSPTPTPTIAPTPPPTASPTATPRVNATPRITPRPPGPTPPPPPTLPPPPTPPPDTTPPMVGTPIANPTTIYESSGCGYTSSTVTVRASDAQSGIASVTLFYRQAINRIFRSKAMFKVPGAVDVWSASISAPDENFDSDISFFVRAIDNAGNQATGQARQDITVVACIR